MSSKCYKFQVWCIVYFCGKMTHHHLCRRKTPHSSERRKKASFPQRVKVVWSIAPHYVHIKIWWCFNCHYAKRRFIDDVKFLMPTVIRLEKDEIYCIDVVCVCALMLCVCVFVVCYWVEHIEQSPYKFDRVSNISAINSERNQENDQSNKNMNRILASLTLSVIIGLCIQTPLCSFCM